MPELVNRMLKAYVSVYKPKKWNEHSFAIDLKKRKFGTSYKPVENLDIDLSSSSPVQGSQHNDDDNPDTATEDEPEEVEETEGDEDIDPMVIPVPPEQVEFVDLQNGLELLARYYYAEWEPSPNGDAAEAIFISCQSSYSKFMELIEVYVSDQPPKCTLEDCAARLAEFEGKTMPKHLAKSREWSTPTTVRAALQEFRDAD